MTTGMDDDLADAFADPRLATLMAELEAIASGPAPDPGHELTALFAGGLPLTPARLPRRHRAASVAVIGLLSGGVLAGGVGAAAADELPAPVQRLVVRVVNTLTPFEIPHPDRPPSKRVPTPTPAPPPPVRSEDNGADTSEDHEDVTDDPSVRTDGDRAEDGDEATDDRGGDHAQRGTADDETDDRDEGDDTTSADDDGAEGGVSDDHESVDDDSSDDHAGDGSGDDSSGEGSGDEGSDGGRD